MKLFLVVMVCTLALSSAAELPGGKMVQLCGADLARAMQRVCVDGDLDFFNFQHQHHHQHDHSDHQHDHQHDHSDHQHDHQHDHHGREHHEGRGHAMKREFTSLADECCLKPCHVKDFVSYCPPQ